MPIIFGRLVLFSSDVYIQGGREVFFKCVYTGREGGREGFLQMCVYWEGRRERGRGSEGVREGGRGGKLVGLKG